MRCPQCHAANPESALVCGGCSLPLLRPCPVCRSDNLITKNFCGECGHPLTDLRPRPANTSTAARAPFGANAQTVASGAERRQLTVMFCDLVGSTELSSRLDPEDLRELISSYHSVVRRAVSCHEGFIAKYMGDGVLVYFGYPQAQEDDAERAVYAGLEVVKAVEELETSEQLKVRVGIATGVVVVGDFVGSGEAQERGIVGETPNLAARLQALAQPNAVVIGSITRNLVGDAFEYDDLGMVSVKGFARPVQAWQVLRSSAIESRFDALHASGFTPLVGRERELESLLLRWKKAKSGSGQVVLLSGEPGIGKSRLLAELRERLRGEPHILIRYFCSPHHQDSALYPFSRQIEHAAAFEREDSPKEKLEKVAALLGPTGVEVGALSVIAALLSLPIDNAERWRHLDPQQRKERTFNVFEIQLTESARKAPVLVLFEDAHWADPSSRELLDRIAAHAVRFPILLVVTFRPEFQPPWGQSADVTLEMLDRLGNDKGVNLIERVAAAKGKRIGSALVDRIVERGDGIPLFLEELTKAILESGYGDITAATSSDDAGATVIPASLQALLTARLDRLGTPAKEIGQLGAALGREFSYDLIRTVAPMSVQELDQQLDKLIAAELIFRRETPSNVIYTFKHSLVQDAAYGTLLRADRQKLHASIAHTLEKHFPERVAREPEVIAQHFLEARQIENALSYLMKAGARAIERSANVEAMRHLTRGLEGVGSLPESASRDRLELALQIAIGTPLIAVKGYSASETGAAFARARILCERLGEVEPLVAALSGEFTFQFVGGNFPMMQRLADEARSLHQRLPHPMIRLASHRLAGITALHSGAFLSSLSEFNSILSTYDASQHRSQPVHYVHDPKVSALAYLAPLCWIMGYPEQAHRFRIEAFDCAAELNQANLTAHVHNFAGAGLDELLGNNAGVQVHSDAILELAERHKLRYWRLNALILHGWTMVQQGDVEAGVALMRENITERAALGVSWYQSRYLLMLAQAYAQLGDAEAGLRVISEANELVTRNNEHIWLAELQRLSGELRHLQGESIPLIESFFERALSIAREQSAKSFELRAACSLGRLWRDQGRRDEARSLLEPIFGWFCEGLDTADLKKARLLLEDLEGIAPGPAPLTELKPNAPPKSAQASDYKPTH
jgi:class 3 adenylate cyclase/predicted ATPase